MTHVNDEGELIKSSKRTRHECISCYSSASIEFIYCDGPCSYRLCLDCLFGFTYIEGDGSKGIKDLRIKCFYCRKPIVMMKGMLRRILSRRRDFFRVLKNQDETLEFHVYKVLKTNEVGISRVIEKETVNDEWIRNEIAPATSYVPVQQQSTFIRNNHDFIAEILRILPQTQLYMPPPPPPPPPLPSQPHPSESYTPPDI